MPGYTMPRSFFPPKCPYYLTVNQEYLNPSRIYNHSMHETLALQPRITPRSNSKIMHHSKGLFPSAFLLSFKTPKTGPGCKK